VSQWKEFPAAALVVGTPLEKLGVTGKRYLPGRSFEYLMRKAYAP